MSKKTLIVRAACTLAVMLCAGYAGAQEMNSTGMADHQGMMIQDGMTQSQVMDTLGRPDRIEKFGNSNDVRWEYDKLDEGALAIDFSSDGKVSNVTHDSEFQE